MGFIDRTARSLLLSELLSGMALTFRYMFKPKATLNYPREGSDQPRFRGEHARATVSERRGALHRLQALRGDLPRVRRSRSRPSLREDGSRRDHALTTST